MSYRSRAAERSRRQPTWKEVQAQQKRRYKEAGRRQGPLYSKDDVRFFRKVFELLDTDGGGSIEEEEFVQGLVKEIGAAEDGDNGGDHVVRQTDRKKFIDSLYKGLQIGYAKDEGADAGNPRSRARAIFKHIDIDGGGSIEFGEMLAALYPLATEDELAQMEQWAPPTHRVDNTHGNRCVSRLAQAWGDEDILRLPASKEHEQETTLKQLFRSYLKVGREHLTVDELAQLFRERETGLSRDDVRDMIEEVGLTENQIGFGEFRVLMKRVTEELTPVRGFDSPRGLDRSSGLG